MKLQKCFLVATRAEYILRNLKVKITYSEIRSLLTEKNVCRSITKTHDRHTWTRSGNCQRKNKTKSCLKKKRDDDSDKLPYLSIYLSISVSISHPTFVLFYLGFLVSIYIYIYIYIGHARNVMVNTVGIVQISWYLFAFPK